MPFTNLLVTPILLKYVNFANFIQEKMLSITSDFLINTTFLSIRKPVAISYVKFPFKIIQILKIIILFH